MAIAPPQWTASLKVGSVATKVDVIGTPLMNQTDATTGYVVDQATIEATPLGTGSFTQLAIMSPGVHADFLGGAGSNAGLGNQAIFANGQRDTSNSFSLNGISTNNLFNGNSTSQVGENRFVFNIGESFGAGGEIQTSTSVYGAIGQALPTPPPEAIQEIAVNSAMYDASQGANSGAHISVLTKSGSNGLHAEVYEKFQNSDMNAAPFFYNASPILSPIFLNRNQFGATVGGPIKKDKLFYFLSYQGVRIADSSDATKEVTVPLTLTDDRSAARNHQHHPGRLRENPRGQPAQPASAWDCCKPRAPMGSILIPSAQITNSATATQLGYDAVVQGPNAQSKVDQGIANVDYVLSDKDRLGVKYYVQTDPTTNPFGAAGVLLGFPQQLSSGSQVISLDNTVILTPSLTWQQRAGFTRMRAYSAYQPSLHAGPVRDHSPGRILSFSANRNRHSRSHHWRKPPIRTQHQFRQCGNVSKPVGIWKHAQLGEGPPYAAVWRVLGSYPAQYHQQQRQHRRRRVQELSKLLPKASSAPAITRRLSPARPIATIVPTPWAHSSTTTTNCAAISP